MSAPVLFVDVSAYQGSAINWAAVKSAGVAGAYVQVSQGTGVVNPDMLAQIEGARNAGIPVGAYHLCYPLLNTPQAEYDYFMSNLGSAPVNLPPMLDDEITIDKAWVLTMLGLMGPQALHYSDASFLAALGSLGYRQWTARPGATGLGAGDFATQYASASLPGFPGSVDLDYFNPAILGGGAMCDQILRDPDDGSEYAMPEGTHLDAAQAAALTAAGVPMVTTLDGADVAALLTDSNANSRATILAALAKLTAGVPGPAGATGPAGPAGPQGAPGVTPTTAVITGTAKLS